MGGGPGGGEGGVLFWKGASVTRVMTAFAEAAGIQLSEHVNFS